jgi:Resolvase, N terminal domain
MTRTAIYARSPDCSLSADRQIDELKRFAAECGWAVEHVFTDHPTSVKKAQDRRSGELALVHAIQSVAVEKVLMWWLCRIGKPLTELHPAKRGQILIARPNPIGRPKVDARSADANLFCNFSN